MPGLLLLVDGVVLAQPAEGLEGHGGDEARRGEQIDGEGRTVDGWLSKPVSLPPLRSRASLERVT
jgi:hypothetical protein